MSLIEFQNVFPMINFDIWDRLGHVQTIFDTVGLWGSIFHCHICEDSVSKWADLSVCKPFIRELLIKGLQTLKSEHFDTESSQVTLGRKVPHTPKFSKKKKSGFLSTSPIIISQFVCFYTHWLSGYVKTPLFLEFLRGTFRPSVTSYGNFLGRGVRIFF